MSRTLFDQYGFMLGQAIQTANYAISAPVKDLAVLTGVEVQIASVLKSALAEAAKVPELASEAAQLNTRAMGILGAVRQSINKM